MVMYGETFYRRHKTITPAAVQKTRTRRHRSPDKDMLPKIEIRLFQNRVAGWLGGGDGGWGWGKRNLFSLKSVKYTLYTVIRSVLQIQRY